jgi:hypothetical protein
MNSEDLKIYRNFTLERLSAKACAEFLQNLAKCNGHISSSFCLNNGFPDESIKYFSMFFRIYFLSQVDLDKFHSLGMVTEEIERVGEI